MYWKVLLLCLVACSEAQAIPAIPRKGRAKPDLFTTGAQRLRTYSNTLSTLLDGTNEYALRLHSTTQYCTNKATWSVWIRAGTIDTSDAIASKWNTSNQANWFIQTDNTNADEIQVFIANDLTDGGNNRCMTTNFNLANATYAHLVIQYDGTQADNATKLKVYKATTQSTCSFNGTIPTTMQQNTANILIGALQTGATQARFWPGNIDEFAMWCSIIDPAVTESGGKPTDLTYLNPLIWLRMGDNDVHPNITDHGTLHGDFTLQNSESTDFEAVVP